MASRGRPVERPAHLSQEERTRAQAQTQQWRQQCGLSQREMAAEIGVGYASYRPWESSRDDHAGPTRQQAGQLDKALRRLLVGRYVEGDAFDIWGWPRQEDMSYDRVVELLRSAGFEVPRPQPNVRPPVAVFWVHRANKPNLVHGVFSLAAAAATRAGLPVHLLLDDLVDSDRRPRDLCGELESQIKTWVAFASGDDTKLSTTLYSEVLYLRPLPMPSYRSPWQEQALAAGTDRSRLTNYLTHRTSSERALLLEWLIRSAVYLPASLNPDFRAGLEPAVHDVTALLRASASELPPETASAITRATVEWLNL